MTDELKPIRTKADYDKALAEAQRLWGAKNRTPEGDRLDVLGTLIDAHERTLSPSRNPNTRCGSPEPKAQPFDRHDPPSARSSWHFCRSADPPVAEKTPA